MRFVVRLALLMLALAAPLAAQESGTVIVRGGWLFDGLHNDRTRNPDIVVRGGKIIRVGAATQADAAGAQIVQVTDGETILPGFFDMHAHYSMNLIGKRRDELVAQPVVYLANGITSTFPGGEMNPEEMHELHNRIERGEQPGPRLFNSGPYWGNARPGWNPKWTAEEIKADVDKWAAQGVRSFKAKGINAEQLRTVIERAHWHGITVTGHLGSGFGSSVNPKDGILMGIDRIEHFMGGDAMSATRDAYASLVEEDVNSPAMKEMYKMFIDHGVYYSATVGVYGQVENPDSLYSYWFDERSLLTPYVLQVQATNPPKPYGELFRRIYEVKQKEIKAFYDAGGKNLITISTDNPSNGTRFNGFNAHRELNVLVRSGIPAADVLKIATINGARAMGVGNVLGSIEQGKFADMFVVSGNPLEDIRNTHKVRLVLKSGHVYESKALLESVKGKLGPASAEEAIAKGWAPAPGERTGRDVSSN